MRLCSECGVAAASVTKPALAKTVTVPAIARLSEVKKGEVKKKAEGVALREWSEVVVPTGANEVEALTYVPGLIGDIVEWIVKGAKRPNRMMALGTALVVGGTLLAQRVRGPTDSGTHVYVIIIAPTGYGKDWPLVCGTRLIEELGLDELLGPSEWASSPGIWKRLRRNPVLICFVDELGDELALVNCQGGNPFVNKVIGALKKCYNAFSTQMTAEKVGEESEKIMWPSPSIIGASTAEKFYGSITPSDLESGFANRLLILPLMGERPAEQLTARNASDPPKELVGELKKLWLPFDWADYPRPRQTLVDWGPGAGEVYQVFSGEMDRWEHVDAMRYQLGMRVCETSARLSTVVACCRGSATVDVEDIEWALRLGRLSFDTACSDYPKYIKQYYEFPVFCRKIYEALLLGRLSDWEMARKFGRNQRWGNELERALKQLEKERRIRRTSWRDGERGPLKEGWQAIQERGE